MTIIGRIQNYHKKLKNNKLRRFLSFVVFVLLIITLSFFGFKNTIIFGAIDQYVGPRINNYSCPLRGEKWIVVTTIFYPTPAISKFLNLITHWNLIVIGDKKTPKDWLAHLPRNSSRLVFISFEQQINLGFRILHYLPQESYARKNLGYLIAIKCGAKIIFESDDTSLLETNDIYLLPKIVQPKHVPWIAFHREKSPFINIYESFGHPHIWPRGFPINELRNVTEDGLHSVRRNFDENAYAYIQQYLADLDPDLDPDVDAIYRLAHPLSIGRIEFDRKQPPIALEPFTFSPYNTKNTVTYYEAFWGLYLPITTSFRVCDIWRGFWVQRLLWDIGGRLIFGRPTVRQIRNSHSYIKDMDDEDQLYHQSGSFVRFLSSWSSTESSLAKRIAQLARDIAQAGFWQSKEIDIMDAWLADLHSIGYVFPSIIESSPSPITQKRAAICVTGLAECFEKGWARTYITIRRHFPGDIDVFLFLSSSFKEEPIPLDTRLQQVRSYMNSTVTIIYRAPVMDPHRPLDCPELFNPHANREPEAVYFQQLWGLTECFDLVKEYTEKMNIRYEFFIRARADSFLSQVPRTLVPPNNWTIIIPDENHFGGYNDRFAVGPIDLMEKYMRRWHILSTCLIKNIHAETFLKLNLNRIHANVQLVKNFTYIEAPHGVGQCH